MVCPSVVHRPALWLLVGTQFIEVVYGGRRRPSQSLVAGLADGNRTSRIMTGEGHTAFNAPGTIDLTTAPAVMLATTTTTTTTRYYYMTTVQ